MMFEMDLESPKPQYAALTLSDEKLLKEIFSLLSKSANPLANPYSDDGSYAASISRLPIGLRAMAATHHLDISLTLDDIGWHFLNFGELGFVRETEAGLRELGLSDMADWFAEAFAIVNPLRPEIDACGDYYECLTQHGHMDRIDELTQKARQKLPTVSKSPIYGAWIRYVREHPENVFGEQMT
jgi:hypothetical protein